MEDDKTYKLKPADDELLRLMIHLSNNSQMTNHAAVRLTNALAKQDLVYVKNWLQHAKRETEYKTSQSRGRYPGAGPWGR